MSTSTLVVQISDCHLPADPNQTYRGIKPHQNLRTLMQKVATLKPDLLLATGDLSEDGSPGSYQALRDAFDPLGVPVLALPGNHDDPKLLADTFPGSPTVSIKVSTHGPWQIIRLNSCLPGKPEGRLSEAALNELEMFLADQQERPCLISLHHQPISINSPWIDKYRLMDSERFLRLIDGHSNVKAVVWGHVHQAYATDRRGTAMLSGPSSAINAIHGVLKFTADPVGPGCRWLELKADGTLLSGIS